MLRLVLLLLGFALLAPPARASLVGSVMRGAYFYGDTATPYGDASLSSGPFTVGEGVEAVLTVDGSVTTAIDVGAATLVLTAGTLVEYAAAPFNGLGLTLLAGEGFGRIRSVIASAGQVVAAFLQGDTLFINWAGQHFEAGDTVTLSFIVVPEPGALLLLGAGLLGLLALRRRRPRTGLI